MTDRLRILLIAHGLPPQQVGGVEQHVEGLALALQEAGHAVTLFSRTDQPGAEGELHTGELHGMPVHRVVYRHEQIHSIHDLYQSPKVDAAFARFLAEYGPFDVAHIHHLTCLSTGIPGLLRGAGIATAMTLHDYWMMCLRGQMWHRDGHPVEAPDPATCADCLRPTFGHWLGEGDEAVTRLQDLHNASRGWLDQIDQLFVPSARSIPFFERFGIAADRFQVIANGVDIERLMTVPGRAGDGPLQIGYLGTLIPSKGLDLLVQACQRLTPDRYRLQIWGNAVPYHGDEGFLTRVFSLLRPDDPVVYHGPYSLQSMPEAIGKIDVLVTPARWHEAFGLTAREALAAGRPVITTRIGGLQDAIEDGVQGLIVPPDDIDASAAALQSLLDDPDRLPQMAAAARAMPSRGFAEMAADLLPHYQRLASTSRAN